VRYVVTQKPDKTVAIIATLDTKGPEAAFVKTQIEAAGYATLVLDTGILGSKDPSALAPDISAEEIAREGGEEREALAARSSDKGIRDRGIRAMSKGSARILSRLYEEGRFRSVLGLGGAQGTEICTSAMRALPLGVPKVMVSTVASGRTPFGIYTGTRDITIMHSVVDILGLNSLTRRILANAAGAAVGMAEAAFVEQESPQPKVGITIYGTTTPGGLAAKALLEARGYEVIAFHPNGTGGLAMEELATEGFLHGLLDFTTHEVTDELFGGIHAGNPERLVASGRARVPRLFVPGSADFMTFAELEKVPEIYRDHAYVPHNPHITLVRANADQMAHLAAAVAERLNKARGPVAVAIPTRGFSFYNREGLIFFDAKANQTYTEALSTKLRSDIPLYEFDTHINDPAFAAEIVPLFDALMKNVKTERVDQ
jgi:uncharacterized protein (UPF0261 family)